MTLQFIPYFQVPSIDDLIRVAYTNLLNHGERIEPSKGKAIEISGITFELTNPRARLSLSASRGRVFSALGEMCWYLSGSANGRVMDYYIPEYSKHNADDPESQECIVNGAYGPRIFCQESPQFENIYEILSRKPFSRQAVIRLFDSKDIAEPHRDVPCTCTLQFLLRDGRLNLITYMRSNDAYKGLPHDVFCFTMFQEIMAARLNCELGYYKHIVGSLHLYSGDEDKVKPFLDEGWYGTVTSMPPIPKTGLEEGKQALLSAEESLRLTGKVDQNLEHIPKYWANMINLLKIHRAMKDKQLEMARSLAENLDAFYFPYATQRIER